jgi:hypothetical protein
MNTIISFSALGVVAPTVRLLDDARASVFNSRFASVLANFNNLKSYRATFCVKAHRLMILLARWLHNR